MQPLGPSLIKWSRQVLRGKMNIGDLVALNCPVHWQLQQRSPMILTLLMWLLLPVWFPCGQQLCLAFELLLLLFHPYSKCHLPEVCADPLLQPASWKMTQPYVCWSLLLWLCLWILGIAQLFWDFFLENQQNQSTPAICLTLHVAGTDIENFTAHSNASFLTDVGVNP